ncbi:MAG: ABC-F family ATP-binding cassette domain-containing protein [Polyangiaceae bacterium]|nr:ABC-F family ATP-binding cassette domain-containing protein [Polyangiaceae bacterium]
MIAISNLSKSFGPQALFEDVTLQLNAGCRYGLVGANGSGKTTFLKILSGTEPASGGEVTFAKHARIGILRQDRFESDEQIILDVAMMGDELVHRALAEQQAHAVDAVPDPERIAEIDEILRAHDGYTLEARAAQVLMGLGIPEAAIRQPLYTLSGGYKLRVLLAQVLVSRPDAVLLDEPTNHLDILSIRWLERFLSSYRGCAVVISHDQRFLNNIATHILDVDYGTVIEYPGNYQAFHDSKLATRERKEGEIARVEKIIAHKKAFVERFKAKASKARQAQSRLKQLEKIEVETLAASSRRYPKLRFEIARPSGKDVLAIEGISKAYGEKRVLSDVSLTVRRGERVAVIGANGLGKSTLLKIITDNLASDGGKVAWGHEAQVGYFAQDHKEQLTNPNQTALDYLWDICPQEGTSTVRGVLGRLLFSGPDVDKPVAALSGGEATRLIFSRLMVQKPNVLVLDEPSNHLDLESIEALVEALEEYKGTLIFVSHDRWFVDKLATRVIEIRPDGLNDFAGTFREYLERQGDDHLDAEQVALAARARKSEAPKPVVVASSSRTNRHRSLPKKRDEVLERIAQVEARLGEINTAYCAPGFFERTPKGEVDRLQQERAGHEAQLAALTAEWEALETEIAALAPES